MIRIVLDTNIFISALLQPNGLPAHILTVALAGERIRLYISAEIYRETVLERSAAGRGRRQFRISVQRQRSAAPCPRKVNQFGRTPSRERQFSHLGESNRS